MITIELRFPANRYHGTGWGRHVNEGVPEWPPSPYRLLRALHDVWKRKLPNISAENIESVLKKLASSPPKFYGAKKVVTAHTRSYLNRNTFDTTAKSLVFDAFVALAPDEACSIEWESDLNAPERTILSELLSGLNYLGRSESWIDAKLSNNATSADLTCWPGHDNSKRGELLFLACPVNPAQYEGKRPWLDALAYSSSEIVREKLSGPPAMQATPYTLSSGVVNTWLPAPRRSAERRISGILLQLSGNVLPPITETVRVSERIRGRIMRLLEERYGKDKIPPIIHGKGPDSLPLKDHSHMFILPQPNDAGLVDRVLLFARDITGNANDFKEELDAILNIGSIRWIGGSKGISKQNPLRASVSWIGKHNDSQFRPAATLVRSITPFITVRHWREGRGTIPEFLQEEVKRECRNHGLPEPLKINHLDSIGGQPTQRFRRARQDDESRPGYAFDLEFSEPVPTPFALGYGCHFGLGQFSKA